MATLDELRRRADQASPPTKQNPAAAARRTFAQTGGLPEAAGAFTGAAGQSFADFAGRQFLDALGRQAATGDILRRFGRGAAGTLPAASPRPGTGTDPRHHELAATPTPTPLTVQSVEWPGAVPSTVTAPTVPGSFATHPQRPPPSRPGQPATHPELRPGQAQRGAQSLTVRGEGGARGDINLPPGVSPAPTPGTFSVVGGRTPEEQAAIRDRVGQLTEAADTIRGLREPAPARAARLPRSPATGNPTLAQMRANMRARDIERDSLGATGGRGVTRASRQAAETARQLPRQRASQAALARRQAEAQLQGTQMQTEAQRQVAQLQAAGQQAQAAGEAAQRDRDFALEQARFQEELFRDRRDARRSGAQESADLTRPFTVPGGVDPQTGLPTERTVQYNPQTGQYEPFNLPPPPTLEQFLESAKADPRNKDISDRELMNYFYQTYGR